VVRASVLRSARRMLGRAFLALIGALPELPAQLTGPAARLLPVDDHHGPPALPAQRRARTLVTFFRVLSIHPPDLQHWLSALTNDDLTHALRGAVR